MKTSYIILIVTTALASLVPSLSFAEMRNKMYISASYGVATSSDSGTLFDGISGKVVAGTVGFRLGDHFAFELLGRSTSFDTLSSSILGINFNTQISALTFGGDLRFFFLKFLNVFAGADYSSVNPNFSSSDPTVQAALGSIATTDTGMGLIYGGGIQIPLGPIDLIGDYTFNQFSGDLTSKEITGGIRLFF